MNVTHVDKRKSRELEDAYPPDGFVEWHDLLVVWDLKPGQWSLTPQGEVMKRLGDRCIYETKGSVIC